MLEKPDLHDEKIVACLRDDYGAQAVSVEFLPLGYDANAGVYRVEVADGDAYFLKAKKGGVDATSLAVPRALRDAGIAQIAAPLLTRDGRLSADADAFALIVYPFIEGTTVMESGLSDDGWRELGAVVRRMHETRLPDDLARQLARESFVPPKIDLLRAVDAAVMARSFEAPYQREMAALWRGQRDLILTIADRAETYGRLLQSRSLPFVLCHADIHTANVLVDAEGQFFIVDWDGAMLAPKERDLMFVTAAGAGAVVAYGDRARDAFFRGYGEVEIDPLAIAYYRCDWVVQDVAEFGHTILLQEDVGDETKADILRNVTGIFEPCNTAEVAYQSDAGLR